MAKSAMKALGTLFEQRFILKCMEHGLHPFSPIEEGLPQDLVVMNHSNELFRVQVKGTKTPVKQCRSHRFKITAATGSETKKLIDCERIDILVAHVDPDIWYIIPCKDVKSVRVWLYPHDSTSSGQYESFRDRWDLFDDLGLIGCKTTFSSETDSNSFFANSQTASNDSWIQSCLEFCED